MESSLYEQRINDTAAQLPHIEGYTSQFIDISNDPQLGYVHEVQQRVASSAELLARSHDIAGSISQFLTHEQAKLCEGSDELIRAQEASIAQTESMLAIQKANLRTTRAISTGLLDAVGERQEDIEKHINNVLGVFEQATTLYANVITEKLTTLNEVITVRQEYQAQLSVTASELEVTRNNKAEIEAEYDVILAKYNISEDVNTQRTVEAQVRYEQDLEQERQHWIHEHDVVSLERAMNMLPAAVPISIEHAQNSELYTAIKHELKIIRERFDELHGKRTELQQAKDIHDAYAMKLEEEVRELESVFEATIAKPFRVALAPFEDALKERESLYQRIHQDFFDTVERVHNFAKNTEASAEEQELSGQFSVPDVGKADEAYVILSDRARSALVRISTMSDVNKGNQAQPELELPTEIVEDSKKSDDLEQEEMPAEPEKPMVAQIVFVDNEAELSNDESVLVVRIPVMSGADKQYKELKNVIT